MKYIIFALIETEGFQFCFVVSNFVRSLARLITNRIIKLPTIFYIVKREIGNNRLAI